MSFAATINNIKIVNFSPFYNDIYLSFCLTLRLQSSIPTNITTINRTEIQEHDNSTLYILLNCEHLEKYIKYYINYYFDEIALKNAVQSPVTKNSLYNWTTFLKFPLRNGIYVPLGYNDIYFRKNHIMYNDIQKDIDILYLGIDNDERIKTIRDNFYKHGLRLWFVYGNDINWIISVIKRSRICVNIHHENTEYLETHMLKTLLSNCSCIVSESTKDEVQKEFQGNVIFVEYDNIVDTCLNLLKDQNRRIIAENGFKFYYNNKKWHNLVNFQQLLPF